MTQACNSEKFMMRFMVLIAVPTNIQVFWDIKLSTGQLLPAFWRSILHPFSGSSSPELHNIQADLNLYTNIKPYIFSRSALYK
jgi:hypothetical protein